VLARAPPASAHDQVVSTSPADGSSVSAPTRVSVTFSEKVLAVEGANRIVVTGPLGPVQGELTARDRVVQLTFAAALPPGPYRVQWRAASSDGHPVSGAFGFSVRAAASTPVSTATAAGPTSASPASTAPTVVATPTSTATASSSPRTQPTSSGGGWGPWLLGALVVAALAATGLIWSARRQAAREQAPDDGSRQ
jgi:methionine-rich copper-binding protein CopC